MPNFVPVFSFLSIITIRIILITTESNSTNKYLLPRMMCRGKSGEADIAGAQGLVCRVWRVLTLKLAGIEKGKPSYATEKFGLPPVGQGKPSQS